MIREAAAGDRGHADLLIGAIRDTGSILAAQQVAERLVMEAKESLDVIAECPGKAMLGVLADAVVDRSH
jgi:geranylgeranyl pyrophosphate synthase